MNTTEELLLKCAQASEANIRAAANHRLSALLAQWQARFGTEPDRQACVPGYREDRLSDTFALIRAIEACLHPIADMDGPMPAQILELVSPEDLEELRIATGEVERDDAAFRSHVRSLTPAAGAANA